MKWIGRLAFALFSYSCTSAYAAYQVEIETSPSLQKLLDTHLDLVRYQDRSDLNEEQLQFMLATVGEQVRALSATAGYFSPVTRVQFEPAASNATGTATLPRVRLHVEAGPQTRIASVTLSFKGAAATSDAQELTEIRQDWSLPVGVAFNQEGWDRAKQEGLDRLQRRRYAAARIASSRAVIAPDTQQAALSVEYDSGPRFTLGPLQISGTQRYPESIIQNVNPLHIGEEYDINRLLNLQRRIQNTPYYSNVIIGIDNDPENADMAPVRVQVSEFQNQRIRTGLGYSSDTGAQVEGRYTNYNVFGSAWVFDSLLQIEQKRQYGLLSLAMPPDEKNFVNSINASLEHTTLEGIDLRSLHTGIRRSRNDELYDTSYSLTYYRDALEQENGAALPSDTIITPGKHQALVPGFSWARRNVDDPIFPRSGNLFTLETGFAIRGIITDQSFGRAYARFRQYFPIGERDVIILRSELGGVFTPGSASEVPASLLFRAGGNDSVRGYAYNSLGNTQSGTVYPTKYLITGSGEYQHWLTPSWGAALFYDTGSVADSWSSRSFYSGVGPGLRWRSPVGSLNLDLAYGIQKRQMRPSISLGIAF